MSNPKSAAWAPRNGQAGAAPRAGAMGSHIRHSVSAFQQGNSISVGIKRRNVRLRQDKEVDQRLVNQPYPKGAE